MKPGVFLSFALLCAAALIASAAEPVAHPFVCTDYTQGGLYRVSRNGAMERLADAPNSNDLWVLPDGNILFVTGHGVKELAPNQGESGGLIVFSYESKSGIYACQRLANGNTFVAECESGRLLEIDPSGAIAKEIRLVPEEQDGGHAFMCNARVLPNGGYLVAHYGLGVVREYDAAGKLVREIPAPGGPHSAVRLPDGNTVVTNWLGHGQFGQGPHVLEVTRDKQVVWTYADHTAFKTISSIVLLDISGDCTKGEILH